MMMMMMLRQILIISVVFISSRAQPGVLMNRAPQFLPNGDMSRFAIPEDTPVGSPVYKLVGSDPEGSKVFYSISGEYFTVDKDSGVVSTLKSFDREKEDLITVVISVTDEGIGGSEPNTVSLLREIPILDINDNYPVFYNRPYSFGLFENTAVGKKLFENVTVQDLDGGINGDVILSCTPPNDETCTTFDVTTEKIAEGQYKGIITLRKPLDYEMRTSYSLTVKATDRAKDPNRRLTATANVVIDVMDIQDQLPVFINAPYSATIPENTEEDTSILRVGARDGDVGDPRTVRIELEDDHLGYFRLVPVTNQNAVPNSNKLISYYDVVTTDVPLDREHPDVLQNGGIYTFSVKAVELINNELPAEHSETTVTVVITDEDDQLPSFNYNLFHINVSESIALDSPLPGLNMIINDKDIGENANYHLSLRPIQNVVNTFAVHPKTGSGHTAVVVRVNDTKNLDYDVSDDRLRTLIFEIVASVPNEYGVVREVAKSRVIIHLQDANDNAPKFANQSYYISVPENVATNTKIYSVAAEDKDSGNFGRIRYFLKGFGSHNFKTDHHRGGIYTSSTTLDYETQKSYNLNLVAIDGGNKTTSTNIYIDIEDVNDNKPTFESKEYSRIIRENAKSFQPEFYVRANDVDGPKQGGGKILYEIISKNYNNDVFNIDKDTGELQIIDEISASDTPKGQYEMVIRAWDYGNPRLHEDVRVNVRVGVIGNQRPFFRGNSKNKNGVSIFKLSVPENIKSDVDIRKLEAIDPDGANSKLTYYIASGGEDNFVVNETTGMLKTSPYSNFDLDKNPNSYELQVITVDSGTPVPETGTTTVIISVTDVNNKPPVFTETYTKYINENTEINATVLTITANDTDETAEIRYRILKPIKVYDKSGLLVENDDDIFVINEKTGDVTLNMKLNHELTNYLVLKIEAEDTKAEDNEQKTTTEAVFYIQASNDKNPIFVNPDWSLKNRIIKIRINEEIDKNSVVYTLKAKDPIKNKTRIKYEAYENNHYDIFNISENGNVIILKKLDYETLERKIFNVSVRAVIIEDLYYDINKKSSKETVLDLQNLPKIRYTDSLLSIEIVNINDNPPIFEEEVYRKRVLESVKYPSVILKVTAWDSDNDTVKYSITGENSNYFEINETTGEITVSRNASLDREKRNVYKFNVTASDKNLLSGRTKIHKTTAQVLVEVLDINDNPPVFSKNLYSTVIPENINVGTMILKVQASDSDLGLSGEVRYKIIEESEALGFFKADAETGEIWTNRILTGKGRNEPYNIIVKASDKGDQVLDSNGKQNQKSLSSEVTLSIYVGDVVKNDGVPVFIKPTLNQKAEVSENASVNTPVFQVIATDPDDANSPEGQIRYKFLDDGKHGEENPFKINSESGLITNKLPLDREKKSSYDLIIVAQDRGDVPQQATRLLHIDIIDVDDHKPYFKRSIDESPLVMKIVEESPVGTEIGFLQALDEDVGENAMIDYIISYGNEENLFNITRTEENAAVITVNGRIDREKSDRHIITVKCYKMLEEGKKLNYLRPYNRQDPSERQILIKIDDIDDNSPKFEKDNMTIGIRLNVPPDTVLTTLHAEDNDIDSPPLEYFINNVTFTRLGKYKNEISHMNNPNDKIFQLDKKTGELKTITTMQTYTDGYFDIMAFANNTNKIEKRANITIRIFMLRDKGLMKFIFKDPPTEVKKRISDLESAVAAAFSDPVAVKVYDTQFHSKKDGSLDFSATSSCFQIIGKEPLDVKSMEGLLNDPKNKELKRIFTKFNIQHVGRCSTSTSKAETSWVQIWVLIISVLIGILAIISACAVCCMHRRYKNHVKRKVLKAEATSTADYMTIRTSRPDLMPSTGSVLGSQLIIPNSQLGGSQLYLSKSDRSVLGSQLMVPKGSQLIINQPATQMGSQLIINSPKPKYASSQSSYSRNGPIIMGSSQMLVPNNIAMINDGDDEVHEIFGHEDLGSQVMYEYVGEGGTDNMGFDGSHGYDVGCD